MYYNQCIICGCNLDPGEGCICEECKEERNDVAPAQMKDAEKEGKARKDKRPKTIYA